MIHTAHHIYSRVHSRVQNRVHSRAKQSRTIPRWICLVVALSILGVWPPLTRAYVPSPEHVMALMLSSIGKTKRISATRKIMIMDPGLPDGKAEFTETLKILRPGRLYMEVQGPQTEKLFVQDNAQFVTVLDGKLVTGGDRRIDRHLEWLLGVTKLQLRTRLESAALDLQQSRLDRWQNRVAIVMGHNKADLQPGVELWVDQEQLVPVRWHFPAHSSRGSDSDLEFRYLEWKSYKNFKFPKWVEIYQNDTLIERIETLSVTGGGDFASDLFDIELIQSIYPPVMETEPVNRSLEEVQETIEQFKRRYN